LCREASDLPTHHALSGRHVREHRAEETQAVATDRTTPGRGEDDFLPKLGPGTHSPYPRRRVSEGLAGGQPAGHRSGNRRKYDQNDTILSSSEREFILPQIREECRAGGRRTSEAEAPQTDKDVIVQAIMYLMNEQLEFDDQTCVLLGKLRFI